MSKFTEDLFDANGNKVKTATWVSIDDTTPETGTPVPNSVMNDVVEAEEAANVENDARTIEQMFQAQNVSNETAELVKLRRTWGDGRYILAFGAWEDLYL